MEEEVLAQGLTLGDWLLAIAVLAGGIAIGRLARTLIARRFAEEEGEISAATTIGRSVGMVLSLAGFVYALVILGVRLTPLLGAIGIGGIAVALAAQTVLTNALASTLLQLRHPFRRGDEIRTNDHEGRVIDVNFRTVVLISPDGERVYIPSSKVIDEPITNLTARRRRRTSLELGIDYDTDLPAAIALLQAAVAAVDGVLSQPAPEVLVEGFGESSIDLSIRFWHAASIADMWRVRSAVAVAAKSALDEAGVAIPFPQRVLSWREGDSPDGAVTSR
jgi:small-conductance mechanosensitive channel